MAAPNPRDLFRGLKSRLPAVALPAALLALTSTSAFAADLPPRYLPPAPRPPAFLPFTWTGLYLGINGGYGWGRVDTTNQAGDTLSFNPKGGLVGGTVGFNYQWAWFVAGVEGDLDWSGMRWNQTSTISDDSFLGIPPTASFSVNYKNNALSTFAARFGVAVDHALFYAKAGGAWTRETFNFSGSDPVLGTLSGSNSFSRLGWMAGAGIEYAVTNNLTVRAEYNYIDFGNTNETLTLNASLAGLATATINSKLTMNVVKFGVNWLFNGR